MATTGEESREAPGNSHGNWPFLKPHERVPEVPIVTREGPGATQDVPQHTHLHSRGKPRVPPQLWRSPVVPSSARDEGSFPWFVVKGFPVYSSHLKRRCSKQESREELQQSCHHSKDPQIYQSTPGEPDFPALPRVSPRVLTHTTVARVTALWHLEGKPKIPVSPRREADTAATAREESRRACLHMRRGLTPL